MDVVITITGKVTIQPDDLGSVCSQNMEELATILHRHGKKIRTDVAEVLPEDAAEDIKILQCKPIEMATKKRRRKKV